MKNSGSLWKTLLSFPYKRKYYPAILLRTTVLAGFIVVSICTIRKSAVLFLAVLVLTVVGVWCHIGSLRDFYRDVLLPAKRIQQISITVPPSCRFPSYSAHLQACFGYMEDVVAKEYTLELLQKQAMLTALQSQINPHFLYNTLDSIRGQVIEEGCIEVADMLEALSSFFRYTITQKSNMVPLELELFHVRNYIKIQQYRFRDRFELVTEGCLEDPLILTYQIPKLTLQPLVENALLHGLTDTIHSGMIKISVVKQDAHIIIQVSDNGCGIDDETLLRLRKELANGAGRQAESPNRHSIALANVNMRIQAVFGDVYGLDISSTRNMGTTISLRLPLTREAPV